MAQQENESGYFGAQTGLIICIGRFIHCGYHVLTCESTKVNINHNRFIENIS